MQRHIFESELYTLELSMNQRNEYRKMSYFYNFFSKSIPNLNNKLLKGAIKWASSSFITIEKNICIVCEEEENFKKNY